MSKAASQPRRLQCLEVWGGNTPVDTALETPGLSAWVYSRPCAGAKAGGDLHYLSSCAAGQITRMLIADVAGHGTAVAETATQLRTLMRKFVNFHDQTRLITAINRQFIPITPAGRFATAVLLTYDADRRELSCSNAGHPLPLHYSAKAKSWSYVGPPSSSDTDNEIANIPLGIDNARYEQSPITTTPGDLLLCYTDGLIEARTPSGDLLSPTGLLDLLGTLDTTPATFLSRLANAVHAMNPGNTAHDDITMLLLSPDPHSMPPGFLKRLIAPFRLLASFVGLYRPPEH
ncbi:MAG TPA: PP2C family protein-serine/threonine phosphatase [Tepidisphaeraceae bacterium]|jgi:serine phosphatase RsbU (regulator of sigma subunit)|nr:PP2C family protein-serine/threonine phosphatase [Tepidisphaeraceae bacterium]